MRIDGRFIIFFVRLSLGCIQVGPYRQSERGEIYKKMADKLVESGWAYPCFCTEEELIAKRKQVHSVCIVGNFLSTAKGDPARVVWRCKYEYSICSFSTALSHVVYTRYRIPGSCSPCSGQVGARWLANRVAALLVSAVFICSTRC